MTSVTETPADACYRCGYDLRGIDDERPCPECGLLARRSRRTTDELHHTRPAWLRRLSRGTNLILLAILLAFAWPFFVVAATESRYALWSVGGPWGWLVWGHMLPLLGLDLAALLLWIGATLLATREGYEPADRADRRLRAILRLAAAVPIAALIIVHVDIELQFRRTGGWWFGGEWRPLQLAAVTLLTAGLVPLPLLLFYHLRGLAKRARSAHLAEHCAIVGIGASCALLYIGLVIVIFANADRWGDYWTARSRIALGLLLATFVSVMLLGLWSLYLLIRFAISFHLAARALRHAWRRDDHAHAHAQA